MGSGKPKPEVFWPYNNSFGFYHPVPLAGKRAQQFVDAQNKCKGGHWTLHTIAQYDEWYNKKGQHLEAIEYGLVG